MLQAFARLGRNRRGDSCRKSQGYPSRLDNIGYSTPCLSPPSNGTPDGHISSSHHAYKVSVFDRFLLCYSGLGIFTSGVAAQNFCHRGCTRWTAKRVEQTNLLECQAETSWLLRSGYCGLVLGFGLVARLQGILRCPVGSFNVWM
jgi:hypothetical protein